MKKSDDVYRRQILDACAKIERFVAGLGEGQLTPSTIPFFQRLGPVQFLKISGKKTVA